MHREPQPRAGLIFQIGRLYLRERMLPCGAARYPAIHVRSQAEVGVPEVLSIRAWNEVWNLESLPEPPPEPPFHVSRTAEPTAACPRRSMSALGGGKIDFRLRDLMSRTETCEREASNVQQNGPVGQVPSVHSRDGGGGGSQLETVTCALG